MIIKKIFYVLIINIFFVMSSFSQNKEELVLLKNILLSIEKQHKVTFSFIEEEIAIFKVISPQKTLTLVEKLSYLSDRTKLEFKIISATYISVINNKNLDKPLCAFLLDYETKLPIISANISFKDIAITTISDENGYFELKNKLPNLILISHVNYENLLLKPEDLYKENCPKIYLKSTITELDEVVTQVYLTKGISKKIDGTYEIKPKKFGLLPGLIEVDVFQTLNQIPGITSVDETISNINVRGGTHDQNLFLWNGIRLFQTGHFFGLISALNPNLAQTIKVTKNGSSAFYGESVSSIVDISTHATSIENNAFSIGLNMINTDVYAKFKTSKNANLELSARRSHTDFSNSPTYKSYYNRIFQNTAVTNLNNNELINYANDEDFYFYDFTVQYKQKINSKIDFSFDAIAISNLLDLKESKKENNIVISKNSFLEQQSLGANVALKINWNKKTLTDLNFYGSFYEVSSENESIQNNQIFNQENTILDTGFRLKNRHQINTKLQFNSGYQFNEIGIRNFDKINSPLFSRKIKDVLKIHAIIAELNYTSENKKLKTTFGIRQNYVEELKTYLFEPRLQFNYSFSNLFFVEILGEKKSQVTSQIVDLQQDFLGIEKRRWILADNEAVPIIKNNQVSVGFTFKKNNWLLSLENFYKTVNGISSRSQAFQNQLEFEKINGSYSVFGTEFLIQKQLNKFTTWLSYSYTNNNYNFESYSTPVFPNNYELKHNIAMALIYDYKKLKIAVGSKWFTGKPNTTPLSNTPIFPTPENPEIVYNTPNSSNLENYFQMNFSGSYEISLSKKSQLLFGFSVLNLLDAKSIINENYRLNRNTNSIEQVNTFTLERTINTFLRYSF